MNIEGLRELQPMEWSLLQRAPEVPAMAGSGIGAAAAVAGSGPAGGTGAAGLVKQFQSALVEGLSSVNQSQTDAMQQVNDFLEGKGPALHTVMLSMEQANLGLEFAVQMRNKVIDAYTEIMHMQV